MFKPFYSFDVIQLPWVYHTKAGSNIQLFFHRESILLYAEDSDYDLQVVLKVIGLLAACCEGENLFIESICQNIISISELMKVFLPYILEYFMGYVS